MVAGIIFEYENVIDFVQSPDSAVQTEKEEEDVHQEVSCIYLEQVSPLFLHGLCRIRTCSR